MSIRTRLTLLFVALAGLSVLAAALVGYSSTAKRVQMEIDQTLRVGVGRAVGPGFDGRICAIDAEALIGRRLDRRRQFGVPGSRLQCIDATGAVVSFNAADPSDSGLPVDAVDRALATQRLAETSFQGGPGVADDRGGQDGRGGWGAQGGRGDRGDPTSIVPSIPRSTRADRPIDVGREEVRIRTVSVNGTSLRIATASIRGGGAIMVARDLDERDRILRGLRQRFALIGIAVVAVAAAVGSVVARAFAKPIRALTGVTALIAAQGALSADARIGSSITNRRDEIGKLASSFSSMLGSLRGSREQQHRLAQDAGHELRTPLTSLRTNVDVLTKYPDLAPENRLAVLREMDAELRELSALTDELLVLATDATPDDPAADVDLFELTQRAVDRFERRTGRKVELIGVPSSIRGRRLQISRAVDNVLANAAKFDPTATSIEVKVHDQSVSVRDHGPGFANEDLGRVFDRFYRADTARQLPGTGLGLAIAAEATKAHGGTATASNHGQGGAIVTLTFGGAEG